MEEHISPIQPKRKSIISAAYTKLFAGLLVLVAVFSLGVAAGNGRLKLHSLTTVNKSLPGNLDYSSVDDVYSLIKKDFDGQITQDQVLDGLKEGLAKATGDQYTEYFNPTDAKDFANQLSGSFEGIGAELGKDNNVIVIVSPLSGYPADKAGLKPKDAIIKIDDQSVYDITISQAVKKIRGPKDSKVKLTIVRDGKTQFDVTITRAEIKIPSVEWKEDNQVGYLKISQFGDDTVALATKAAQEFKDKKVKAVVLDLRGDPGGYLDGAVSVSSLWLNNNQKVVEERRGETTLDTKYAKGDPLLSGIPTVVLINEGSASASEITAGALRDNNAATLVGAKSFGKGSVQQVEQLSNGGTLKVTIARWYTPNGKNIDKEGITPDQLVAISDADTKAGKDPQKDKAYEILQKLIK